MISFSSPEYDKLFTNHPYFSVFCCLSNSMLRLAHTAISFISLEHISITTVNQCKAVSYREYILAFDRVNRLNVIHRFAVGMNSRELM